MFNRLTLSNRLPSLFETQPRVAMDASEQLALHLPQLRNYIAAKVPEHQDVDDLLQETVCKTLSATQSGQIKNPLAYATQVAKSIIVEHWRRRSVQLLPLEEVELLVELSPETHNLQKQKVAEVMTALNDMPPLRRDIFLKRRLEGGSRDELAQEFGISVEAVKKHLTRAMVSLTLELEKL